MILGTDYAKIYVKTLWPKGQDKLERNYEGIKKYYNKFTKGKYGEIDDQTYSDLSMEKIFDNIDRTQSSAGEAILHNMLREPVRNQEELDRRSKVIESFTENEKSRIEVQKELFNLGKNKNFDFLEFITKDLEGNKNKRMVYFLLGRIAPILIIILIIIKYELFVLLLPLVIINGIIASKERGLENDKPIGGIYYAGKMVKTSEAILKIDASELDYYKTRLETSMKNLGSDGKKFKRIASSFIDGVSKFELLGPFIEAYSTVVLQVENYYYDMAGNVSEYKKELKEIYDVLGEIDALIAIAAYKEDSQYETSKPIFTTDNKNFKIVKGAHPLIKNVVTNSIEIDNKGIVLTGTNMSGKSTFLRMLGVNIVFAQSFNFVHAEEYQAPFLNIVSSISPDDDINEGKSYYLAEAEAILRIINSLDKEIKVFCLIDEIFRGTNPIERIAASEEILRYIQEKDSISLVATHDKELTDFLSKSHKFYHFSEDVNDKDGLSFDYKLKKGVLKTRNAIKLLKYVGYPDDIINGAYKNIEKSEEKQGYENKSNKKTKYCKKLFSMWRKK